MTEKPRCQECRRILPDREGRGRPRKFCSQACRQWNWVHQQRGRELELTENELVVARDQIDELHDELYVMACAVDDAERDLADAPTDPVELRRVVDWLLSAARPLRDREFKSHD